MSSGVTIAECFEVDECNRLLAPADNASEANPDDRLIREWTL